MIDYNLLLNNPLIPEGYYFAKVVEIESEPSDYNFPKIMVRLQVDPMYGFPRNTCLRAILNPTEKSYYHYKNFFNTYMPGLDADDLTKAIGNWGSINVYNSEFGDVEYSTVKFCYQPIAIRLDACRLAKAEQAEGNEKIGSHPPK